MFRRYNSIVCHSSTLLIRGILERGYGGVTSLLADQLDILNLKDRTPPLGTSAHCAEEQIFWLSNSR